MVQHRTFFKIFRKALIDSLPVMMGYLTMGIAAGILLAKTVQMGQLPLFAFLSSSTSVSGTLQFVFVDWLRNPAPFISILILTICINSRYAMYGLSMLDRWRGIPLFKKIFLIWTLTDETYALQCAHDEPNPKLDLVYCILIAALNMSYWVIGVTAGTLLGERIQMNSKGIDFAMTALFLVILTDQCKVKENRWPAVIGIAIAALSRCFFDVRNMLLPAIPVLLVTLFLLRRKLVDDANGCEVEK